MQISSVLAPHVRGCAAAGQAGEDERLSAPAKVDVAQLLGVGLEIASLREVSLTGSHPAAARAWPARDFAPGDPFFNVDPALRRAAPVAVPEGFDAQGRWVGADGRLRGGASFKPRDPLPDYSAGSGGGWALGKPRLVVALQPSEIRTFELTLRQLAAGAQQ